MPNMISYTHAPSVLDADGVCQAQTTAGAGPLVINGVLATAGVAAFGEQAHVTLSSAGALGGINFTVTGTSTQGAAVSETLAGPAGGTVTTAANFKTVTRVYADAAVGDNVTVGVSDALEGPWKALDSRKVTKGISVAVSAGASLTYEVQYSPQTLDGLQEDTLLALADTTLTAKTDSAGLVTLIPWPLIRLKITSFVSGTATLRVIELGV